MGHKNITYHPIEPGPFGPQGEPGPRGESGPLGYYNPIGFDESKSKSGCDATISHNHQTFYNPYNFEQIFDNNTPMFSGTSGAFPWKDDSFGLPLDSNLSGSTFGTFHWIDDSFDPPQECTDKGRVFSEEDPFGEENWDQ
jgi:hypothetical protein